MDRLLALVFVSTLCLMSTPVRADSELYIPELRYTCAKNLAIDIHLAEHAASTGVNENWLGTTVQLERTFTLEDGYPKKAKPIVYECALWSGTYTALIGTTWLPERVIAGVYPTITVFHDGKTVLPTTVLGVCETKSLKETLGACNKDWGVRIFIGESIDRLVDGKPVGVYASVNVYRVTQDSVSYGRVR